MVNNHGHCLPHNARKMNVSVGIWANILLSLIDVVITLPLNNTSVDNQATNKLYQSPWNSIKDPAPKIIDFDENGDVKEIEVPPQNIIKTYSITSDAEHNDDDNDVDRYLFQLDRHDFYDGINITKYILKNMQKRINKVYNKAFRTKVLTHCNEDRTFCRFLMCPFVKEFCTLCEVKIKEDSKKNTTTVCEKISTDFLFKQINN